MHDGIDGIDYERMKSELREELMEYFKAELERMKCDEKCKLELEVEKMRKQCEKAGNLAGWRLWKEDMYRNLQCG